MSPEFGTSYCPACDTMVSIPHKCPHDKDGDLNQKELESAEEAKKEDDAANENNQNGHKPGKK